MAKILLTRGSNIFGGVETFVGHLSNVFPDLQIIDWSIAKGKLSYIAPPLKEPMIARAINKYFFERYKKDTADVVFTNGMYGWYLSPEKIKMPIINISHGGWGAFADHAVRRNSLDYYRLRYIYSYFEKLSAKNATLRVSNSGFTRRQLKKYCGLDSRVIYNAVDTKTFNPVQKEDAREMLNLPKEEKIGIFVGPPAYSKGFDTILKLSKIHSDVDFLCVINAPIKTKQKNMMMRTNIEQKELYKYYSAADFLIFPSRFEGFGYVPLEALACNTPIIASKTGILTEVTPPGGWIIESHDHKKYSNAINEVLKLEELPETRGFVTQNFSFDRFARGYRTLIAE